MPSTDKSSRRLTRHTTRTRRANSLIGRGPDKDSAFTTCPCVMLNYRKAPGRMTSGITAPITCTANDTHPPMPPFEMVPCTTGLNYNGMGPDCLQ
ncbi:hypothetical protein TNCV_273521 [Trichonephila clavipes]|nr:hypothetical protein TNCV_273521 [Trichonephila clavipes]